jgi:hypothetical protein
MNSRRNPGRNPERESSLPGINTRYKKPKLDIEPADNEAAPTTSGHAKPGKLPILKKNTTATATAKRKKAVEIEAAGTDEELDLKPLSSKRSKSTAKDAKGAKRLLEIKKKAVTKQKKALDTEVSENEAGLDLGPSSSKQITGQILDNYQGSDGFEVFEDLAKDCDVTDDDLPFSPTNAKER